MMIFTVATKGYLMMLASTLMDSLGGHPVFTQFSLRARLSQMKH